MLFRVNFTQTNSSGLGESEKFSIDESLCWASCFITGNNYHKKFLEIIQKLQEEQAAKNTKGTCFVIDGSVSRLADEPASIYNYERNLAIMLSLTLPVNGTNPMFGVKYQNYGSCSERYQVIIIVIIIIIIIITRTCPARAPPAPPPRPLPATAT